MRPLVPLLLVTLLLGAGCSEPGVGGAGRLSFRGERPVRLVLEGSPHEMGWWQGHLLREQVRAAHEELQAAAFGRPGGEALRSACEVYVEETLRRLPEGLRQELEGMAAGSGVPARRLLLTEVMGDGLRFHGIGPDLPGGLAWAARGSGDDGAGVGGPEAQAASATRTAALLAAHALFVERRPARGPATLLLAWPGSLGGVAGASDRGLTALAVGIDLPLEQQRLSALPYPVRLRSALEQASGVADLVASTGDATAHRLLAVDGPQGRGLLAVSALAATAGPDLSEVPAFVLPPLPGPDGVDLEAGRRADLAAALAGLEPGPEGARWGFAWGEGGWRGTLWTGAPGGPAPIEADLPVAGTPVR